MSETELKISGMSCNHCVARVTKALESLEGVESAEVSLEKGQAVVKYDSSKVGKDRFKDAVEKAGYSLVG